MASHLAALEEEALELMNNGQKEEAAGLFSQIVAERPDWEHGGAAYDLAGCLEDLGQLDQARLYYQQAVHYDPGNPYFWGGYASFLYLHGNPQEAFDTHIRLLTIDRRSKTSGKGEGVVRILRELASKLGMDEDQFNSRIKSAS